MSGPLTGLRVVELAGIGPGPFAAMLLADLGAEVVRVDRPGSRPEYGEASGDLLNRGRRSIAVDLKHPRGPGVVLDMVAGADVLIEGFRPGVAERLGLGPRECHAVNPRLVYGRMTGWGQTGPLAHVAGHDVNYVAITGALHAIGRADGPPQIPLNLLGDFAGGSLYLVSGILAALHERTRSGQGDVVDAAIVDGVAHLSTMFWGMKAQGIWSDTRGVNINDTGRAYYDVYRCADGRHVTVGTIEDRFYVQLVAELGLDEPLPDRHDPGSVAELRELIAARFATATRDEWTERFYGSDACVAPVLTFDEATRDPHLVDRGVFVDDGGPVQPAPAPRFERSVTGSRRSRPPAPGEQSRAVLADWGLADADGLIASGAVVEAG